MDNYYWTKIKSKPDAGSVPMQSIENIDTSTLFTYYRLTIILRIHFCLSLVFITNVIDQNIGMLYANNLCI
jgi:hypothetical protein